MTFLLAEPRGEGGIYPDSHDKVSFFCLHFFIKKSFRFLFFSHEVGPLGRSDISEVVSILEKKIS